VACAPARALKRPARAKIGSGRGTRARGLCADDVRQRSEVDLGRGEWLNTAIWETPDPVHCHAPSSLRGRPRAEARLRRTWGGPPRDGFFRGETYARHAPMRSRAISADIQRKMTGDGCRDPVPWLRCGCFGSRLYVDFGINQGPGAVFPRIVANGFL
jgi:hypothetical protein